MAGPVRIAILGDASSAQAAFARTSTAATTMRSRVATAASAVTRVTAGVAVAAGGLAATMGTIGVKAAASMQQSQIAFSTLLGSSTKAKKFLGDLSTFAAKTPFTMPGLVDASRQLVGAGQSAQSVIPTLTAFGDTAGALGLSQEQFNRVMLATTQALGKGKFQAEELLQITEAGIPAWRLLSRALGRPVAELQELSKEGKLVATQVLPRLEAQMRKDYGGAMAKQSQTLAGQWSTLTDTINMGLGQAIMPLTPLLGQAATAATNLAGNGLAKLTKWISGEAVPWINRFREQWTAGLDGSLGGRTRQLVDSVLGALRELFGTGDGQTATQVRELGTSITGLAPLIGDLAAALPSMNDMLTVSTTVFGFLAEHQDLLARSLPVLVAALVAFKLAQLGANVAAAVAVPLKVAEMATNAKLAASNRVLAASMKANTATRVADTAAARANTVAESAGLLTRVRSTAALVTSKVAMVAVSAATKTWTAAQWLLNASMLANPVGLVVLAVVALVAAIVIAWKKSETFRKVVTGAWEGIKKAGLAVFGGLRAYFTFVFGLYKSIFTTGVAVLVGAWRGVLAAARWVTDLRDRILGTITGLISKFVGFGRDLMRGLVDGIRAGIGWVRDQVRALGSLLPDWLEKVLGIASPSTVMARIGAQVTQGLARGVVGQAGALRRAMSTVSDVMTGGVSPQLAGILGGGALQIQPAAAAGAQAVTIQVNVPASADPAEVGRHVVRAVEAYERRTGRRVLAAA